MKKAYKSPTIVRIVGYENEAGGLLGGVAVWVIGIGPAWGWNP